MCLQFGAKGVLKGWEHSSRQILDNVLDVSIEPLLALSAAGNVLHFLCHIYTSPHGIWNSLECNQARRRSLL